MDVLTRLIQLARPQASLELRCTLEGHFAFDHVQTADGLAPFHLLLAGSCLLRPARGPALRLRAGDFVLFPRGGAHTVAQVPEASAGATPVTLVDDGPLPRRRNGSGTDAGAEVDLLCGHFACPPGAARLLMRLLPDPLHVPLADFAGGDAAGTTLQALVGMIRTEADSRQPGALAVVTALSQALFALALRAHGQRRPAGASVLALLADPRLGPSVQAMLDDLGRAWTIEALGGIAAMSRATYARRFLAAAGMPVFQFLLGLRMAHAADLLDTTRRSAADIGMEVGYQSEAAFGKGFARALGVTPGRYRARQR